MSKLHEKSPCCGAFTRRFGGRRRQCAACRRTRSLYCHGRGRKHRRINSTLARNYLSNGSVNLTRHAKRLNISVPALRHRLRQSRDCLLEQESWLEPTNKGRLIVIADALLEYIDDQPFVLYLILLKSPDVDKAVILEPQLYPRYENKDDWLRVLNRLPKAVFSRIVAFIADGKPCFISICKAHGWVLQRCHFHLLAELQRFASFKRKSKNQRLVKYIRKHVLILITTTDQQQLTHSKLRLQHLIADPTVPARLKIRFLKGFLRNMDYYRSYLSHPALNFPSTTNSCEALCGIIRKLLFQVRGYNTPTALINWTKALLLTRKQISCKSAKYQQN